MVDHLLVKVYLLAHFKIFILIVRALRMTITLEAWVYAGVGPRAVEVVLICAGDAVEARRRT